MGSLFRSEEMTLAQLYLQSDSAYHCLSELGELGLVQFRDLNSGVNTFQRRFVSEVRRCDELDRRLRFLEKEMETSGINIPDAYDDTDVPPPSDLIELEAKFSKLEAEIREINSNQERLNRNFLELTELKHIFRQTMDFFPEAEQALGQEATSRRYVAEDELGLLDDSRVRNYPLSFVVGVIHRDRLPVFERLLWRACRGNVFLRHQEVDVELKDPATGNSMLKSVFAIFFQGIQLRNRVSKICEGFRATLYPCPETVAERREMAMGVATRIEDLSTILSRTLDHRYLVLQAMARDLRKWTAKVEKIKAIYHTLNLFNVDVTQKCLIGECWCPVADLERIQHSLRRGHECSGSNVMPILNVMKTSMNPPTYNKVNKFTTAFQNIIDAYGVATYQEVNPTPFSIITFPFLFAVMFGDMGHGLLMLLFALFLVLKEKQLAHFKGGGEIFSTFFGGRYIILLMGAFSIYTGLVYNDCFSKSFNIFGSSWSTSSINMAMHQPDVVTLSLDKDFDTCNPYPLGLDPIWQVAENKLTFTNSYKMKMSVILGFMQMMFGIVLGAFNHMYFKRTLDIWASFVPEVLFLGSIFGYLVLMIFYKWIAITSKFLSVCDNNDNKGCDGAPGLLIMLIDMFLSPGQTVEYKKRFYEGQGGVQTLLVLVAAMAVPWMLLTKPIVLYMRQRPKKRSSYVEFEKMKHEVEASTLSSDKSDAGEGHGHSDSMSDIVVHQAIHTIEFCLGCISNTASYLRLWALSLAHAELSEVLWNMMMRIGLQESSFGGTFLVFCTFAAWAVLTICILLIMEGLSAFLHALRLHWVEFNNKFYAGEGYKFQPFSFKLLLEGGGEN